VRLVIPKSLRDNFNNKREIRRSLQTDSRRLATKRAKIYRIHFETITDELLNKKDDSIGNAHHKIIDSLKSKIEVTLPNGERATIDTTKDALPDGLKGSFFAHQTTLKGETAANLPDGNQKAVSGEITHNLLENENSTQHKEYLTHQLREEAKRVEEHEEKKAASEQNERRAEELHQAQMAALASAQTSIPAPPVPAGERLSSLSEKYFKYKKQPNIKKGWKSESTIRLNENKIKNFIALIGDIPITDFTMKEAKRSIRAAYALPKNFNNSSHQAKFQGVTIDQILNQDTETPDFETRKIGSVFEDLKTIHTFLRWVHDSPELKDNLEDPLKVLKREITSIDCPKTRRGFSPTELKTLFELDNASSENYVKGFHSKRGLDPYLKYWLPLIALYSGATIAEICQLHLDDIFEKEAHDGSKHWVFDIYEDASKGTRTKNKEHRPRSIPIHSVLIKLGLLDYMDNLKSKGEKTLFPSAKRKNGGFNAESSCWADYSDHAGVTDSDTTFHSLRYTLNTHLSNKHVQEELQTAISGHAFGSMSKGLYSDGKRGFDVAPIAEAINSIDYGLNHPLFKLKEKQ